MIKPELLAARLKINSINNLNKHSITVPSALSACLNKITVKRGSLAISYASTNTIICTPHPICCG
jgi:hypothetical protein